MSRDDLLKPFVPSQRDPFDLAKAGHLLRRAAFAGSLEERNLLVEIGVERAVDRMFAAGPGEDVDRGFEDILALDNLEQARAYRVWRLLRGRHRLRERMSYFWHDHFATSNEKVKSPRMMLHQLATFDELGLGRFDDLLQAVSRDPAMIRWLDNETNVAGRPNENFARELFELFALGLDNYTQRDIAEAARAFTGWHLQGEQFRFVRGCYDDGVKEVFGRKGPFGGEDIVAMTAERPASSRFIARKLLAFFVHPSPTDAEMAALGEVYRDEKRHIGDTLNVLLRSRLFFSSRAYRSRIKSPADFAVGMVRSLGTTAAPHPLGAAMGTMGQRLLEPPNVAGWKPERAWITSATWLARSNFVARFFDSQYKVRTSAHALLSSADNAEERADLAIELLLDGQIPDQSRARIRAVAAENSDETHLLHAVQCLPEGQML